MGSGSSTFANIREVELKNVYIQSKSNQLVLQVRHSHWGEDNEVSNIKPLAKQIKAFKLKGLISKTNFTRWFKMITVETTINYGTSRTRWPLRQIFNTER